MMVYVPRDRTVMEEAFYFALAASSPWYANWQVRHLFSKHVDKGYPLRCKARAVVVYDRSLDLVETGRCNRLQSEDQQQGEL